jgi:hypothetical protein
MTNSKLQAAIDELERLYGTVKAFKARNGTLPNPDSDAGRAVFALEAFAGEFYCSTVSNQRRTSPRS